MKILLVEDDAATAQTLQKSLGKYYVVELANTAEEGESLSHVNPYDVIIIDYLLPDGNGIELCKKMRENHVQVPIIMLTGTSDVEIKVAALNSGADDYLTKPYHIEELHARIEAVLRRSETLAPVELLVVDDLILDLGKKTASRGGHSLRLRRKEVDLLEYLMRNAGNVVTRSMIYDHVWESESEIVTNVVDVHVKHLRDLIDRQHPKKLIHTVHGYGYKIDIS